MARLHFDRLGFGALRHHALLCWIDRPIFGGHHVPGLLLFYPPVAIAVGLERLGCLRHGLFDRGTALTFIERECGNIDERHNLWMIAGFGDVTLVDMAAHAGLEERTFLRRFRKHSRM